MRPRLVIAGHVTVLMVAGLFSSFRLAAQDLAPASAQPKDTQTVNSP